MLGKGILIFFVQIHLICGLEVGVLIGHVHPIIPLDVGVALIWMLPIKVLTAWIHHDFGDLVALWFMKVSLQACGLRVYSEDKVDFGLKGGISIPSATGLSV